MPRILYTECPSRVAAIDALWAVHVLADTQHWVLPDGCWTLSIGIRPRWYIRLRPPALVPFCAPGYAGESSIGVRFRPGVAPTGLLQLLRERVRPEQSPVEIFAMVEELSASELPVPDERISEMVSMVRLHRGMVPVSSAARHVGTGERQLERLSSASLGLTPKAFARVTRLQSVIRRLIAEPSCGLASLAAEFEYTDQTHMTREFLALGQLTPGAYVRMIRDVGFVLEGRLGSG